MKRIPTLLLCPLAALFILSAAVTPLYGSSISQDGWTSDVVGLATNSGSLITSNSIYQLSSSGKAGSSTLDGLQWMHRSWTGDVVVTARILSLNSASGWARAGWLIESSRGPAAARLFFGLTSSRGLLVEHRLRGGASAEREVFDTAPALNEQRSTLPRSPTAWAGTNISTARAPAWLRIVRQADVFSSYFSIDGLSWQWVSTERLPLPGIVQIGLAVATGNDNEPARASFDQLITGLPTTNAPANNGVGSGLAATYNDLDSTNTLQTADPNINFHWGKQRPSLDSVFRNFSASWVGYLKAQRSEPYAFELTHNDRARLYVNGQLVIDAWEDEDTRKDRTVVNLTAGQVYTFRFEYSHHREKPVVSLKWSSPSTPKQIIPASQFYLPTDNPTNGVEQAGPFMDANAGIAALRSTDQSPNVPLPWLTRIIGNSTGTSTVLVTNGTVYVVCQGNGSGRAQDQGRLVYQPWQGDTEISARFFKISGEARNYRMGVVIRESLREDARTVFLEANQEGKRYVFYRTEPNQGQVWRYPRNASPWLKLVRRGNTFTAYASDDGVKWVWHTSIEVPMKPGVFVGVLAGTSDSRPFNARIDDVYVGSPSSSTAVVGAGDGLTATYSGQGTNVTQVEPQINFIWHHNLPVTGASSLEFSAKWEGLVEAQYSEKYRIQLFSDGDAKLWFNGKMVRSGSTGSARTDKSVAVSMIAGRRYAIRVEYAKPGSNATVRLFWTSPSIGKTPIPQSQLFSTNNPAFADIPDKDHDGMPDDWEIANGLDPWNAADASQDPDADGLTNLQEYQAGTDPHNPDTDGDGLPDGYELAHGLNPLDPADATRDDDHDGLTNLQEYQTGTDPRNADTDRDGIPDGVEVSEMGSNPLAPDTTGVTNVFEIPGSDIVTNVGAWSEGRGTIYCTSDRGWVEYFITAPVADMYRLELEGRSKTDHDIHHQFELCAWLDGEYLGRSVLTSADRALGSTQVMTPWLGAGRHRVRVLWDNGYCNRVLEISAVRLQSLLGPDANNNGVKDWVEKRLSGMCTVDVAPQNSSVSPVCIEGRGRYLGMMNIQGSSIISPGSNERWYANVPLLQTGPRTVVCSFQNGGYLTTNLISWKPASILQAASNIAVRVGDALLLTAKPTGATGGQMQISIVGATNYTTGAATPVAHQFTSPGTFQISGTYTALNGTSTNRTISVAVLPPPLMSESAMWAGKWRLWSCPLSNSLAVQCGPEMELDFIEKAAAGTTNRYLAEIKRPELSQFVVRVGNNGSIVTNIPAQGFRVFAAEEMGIRHLKSYDDGSELVEMGLVISPLRPQLTVRIEAYAGGVIFEDGTVSKQLRFADFDAVGRAFVRFVRPPTYKTSVCHQITVFEGTTVLGTYP